VIAVFLISVTAGLGVLALLEVPLAGALVASLVASLVAERVIARRRAAPRPRRAAPASRRAAPASRRAQRSRH
jgi:hypothetical protein